MIISRPQLQSLIERDGLVSNAFLRECLGPASYDLRIGSVWSPNAKERRDLQDGEDYSLEPQAYALFGTIEKINMPKSLSGLIFLRSTYARMGMLPWSQGLVDPGFSGSLTLALHNQSRDQISVRRGDRIAHIVFVQLSSPTDMPYSSSYQNSQGASEAKLR